MRAEREDRPTDANHKGLLGICSTVRGLLVAADRDEVLTRHRVGQVLLGVKGAPHTHGQRSIERVAEELGITARVHYRYIEVAENWSEGDLRTQLHESQSRSSAAVHEGEMVHAALKEGIQTASRMDGDVRRFEEALGERLAGLDDGVDEGLLTRALESFEHLQARVESTVARLRAATQSTRRIRCARRPGLSDHVATPVAVHSIVISEDDAGHCTGGWTIGYPTQIAGCAARTSGVLIVSDASQPNLLNVLEREASASGPTACGPVSRPSASDHPLLTVRTSVPTDPSSCGLP